MIILSNSANSQDVVKFKTQALTIENIEPVKSVKQYDVKVLVVFDTKNDKIQVYLNDQDFDIIENKPTQEDGESKAKSYILVDKSGIRCKGSLFKDKKTGLYSLNITYPNVEYRYIMSIQ